MTTNSRTLQAAILSIALMIPGASAFAAPRHHHSTHYSGRTHYHSARSASTYHSPLAYQQANALRTKTVRPVTRVIYPQTSSTGYYAPARHTHHYSQTRGTVVGAVAGAVIDHKHPLRGAVIGGVLGNIIQHERSIHSN